MPLATPSQLRPLCRLALVPALALTLASCARTDRETYFESRHRVLNSAPSREALPPTWHAGQLRAAGALSPELLPAP